MVALRASRQAFLFPYTSQIHARSVAHTPFQTVSEGVFSEVRMAPALAVSRKMCRVADVRALDLSHTLLSV